MFESVFVNGLTVPMFFLCLGVALVTGIVFSFMTQFRSLSSQSFFITTAMLPMSVAMVIALVNGNVGAGVAVAGAFALVRFRSAEGTAREICVIFIAMTSGLAFGTGYIAYGVVFVLLSGGVLMLFSLLDLWHKRPQRKDRLLNVTIPEDLDYGSVFDDLMKEYTDSHELLRVKTTNMGSMFRLYYKIRLKDAAREKEFVDELRCRNGNLEISIACITEDERDL